MKRVAFLLALAATLALAVVAAAAPPPPVRRSAPAESSSPNAVIVDAGPVGEPGERRADIGRPFTGARLLGGRIRNSDYPAASRRAAGAKIAQRKRSGSWLRAKAPIGERLTPRICPAAAPAQSPATPRG